jgi:hypothetical protein
MEITEILRQFEWLGTEFPAEAVAAALRQREAITPALLDILRRVVARQIPRDGDREYMAHLFAMYLLAQFREPRAYPLVVQIALMPEEDLDEDFGDFVTVDLNSVLASVCGGDTAGIEEIIEREDANPWARCAAISSLPALVVAGIISREEVLEYFRALYRGKLARVPENDIVWSEVVCCTADLYPEELMDDIERAYEDDLVDVTIVDLQDVRNDLTKGKQQVLAELSAKRDYRFIDDVAESFGSWDCFKDDDEDDSDLWDDPDGEEEENDVWSPAFSSYADSPFTETVRRTGPKIGRNEPCPCGSGKKYKKCCLPISEHTSTLLD